MGTSKWYNSVPVKDNCALCLPTPLFSGSCNLTVLFKFTPYRPVLPSVAIATIQKLQNFALQPMEISKRYNSAPVKDNCSLFAPTPLFSGPHYPIVSFKFCHGNKFRDKIDYNSSPTKANCSLFSPTPYFCARSMQRCYVNFSPKPPVVMATNRFYSKTKLAAG